MRAVAVGFEVRPLEHQAGTWVAAETAAEAAMDEVEMAQAEGEMAAAEEMGVVETAAEAVA